MTATMIPDQRGKPYQVIRALGRRWPTALGLLTAAVTVGGGDRAAHGVWDFVHLKLDRAVSRSYAEWCGVLDVVTAAWLLALAW